MRLLLIAHDNKPIVSSMNAENLRFARYGEIANFRLGIFIAVRVGIPAMRGTVCTWLIHKPSDMRSIYPIVVDRGQQRCGLLPDYFGHLSCYGLMDDYSSSDLAGTRCVFCLRLSCVQGEEADGGPAHCRDTGSDRARSHGPRTAAGRTTATCLRTRIRRPSQLVSPRHY